MAVFIRWEWKEKTRTFLVIFNFIDDKTKQNLRFRDKTFTGFDEFVVLEDAVNNPDAPSQPIMTWAPTHVEIALLADVLRYANIIDGLGDHEKQRLRGKLEIHVKEKEPYPFDTVDDWNELLRDAPVSTTMISFEGSDKWFFASRLDPQYLDYLRTIIAPYQHDR